jgi:hypothetical protein
MKGQCEDLEDARRLRWQFECSKIFNFINNVFRCLHLKHVIFALSLCPSDRHFAADIIRGCDICMGDLIRRETGNTF